mmetsp:Transcript_48633/g.135902  ORF Transcript_48633/g.135902 Transcript_48633/m.135902 type:complete len:102 (+) Transcript_48633:646-951(+)
MITKACAVPRYPLLSILQGRAVLMQSPQWLSGLTTLCPEFAKLPRLHLGESAREVVIQPQLANCWDGCTYPLRWTMHVSDVLRWLQSVNLRLRVTATQSPL